MSKSTASLFGLVGLAPNRLDFVSLGHDLANAQAEVLFLPNSAGIIAIWDNVLLHRLATIDDVHVITLGTPRWSGPVPPGASPQDDVASLIAVAFKRFGKEALQNVAGNFALAIIDRTTNQVLLAIDRLGIETMVYGKSKSGCLAFATDLTLLRRHSNLDFSVNRQAIFNYTYFHNVPSPITIYSGISKLPPSHCLVFKNGQANTERYWLPTFNRPRPAKTSDLEDELFRVLKTAIARCEPDSSTGSFLSGGLDSSTVSGLLSQNLGTSSQAYSIGFDIASYDEIYYARKAASHFNLKHHVHYISPDEIADTIPIIASAYDEPFGNSSAVPTYLCAMTAKQNGTSTLLAGDGGDELFAGNSRYTRQLLFSYYFRIPSALRTWLVEPILCGPNRSWRIGPFRKMRRYIEQAKIPMPERLQTYNLLEMRPLENIFRPEYLGAINPLQPTSLLREEYQVANTDPLNSMLLSDWRFTLADNDLRKVRKTCALAGVNVKFPLLDDDVVDFSTKIPPDWKIRHLRLRHFYRRALRRYLPTDVIHKSKHGFGLPFGEWLSCSPRLQEMVYDALSDLGNRQILREDFIQELIKDHRESHAAFFGNMIWVLAMLEWWLQRHDASFSNSK